jgi:hypothetical protein
VRGARRRPLQSERAALREAAALDRVFGDHRGERGKYSPRAAEPALRLGRKRHRTRSVHFQESFVGKQGFDEHCAAPTFAAWEAFAGSDPFTAEPSVQFYVPTTSVAADHAPCVCVAAFLAALDFVPRGC